MKRLFYAFQTLVTLVTCIVILASAAAFAPRLFGLTTLVVKTDSMAPAIPAGSAVLLDPASFVPEEGDVITFAMSAEAFSGAEEEEGNIYVTHRVKEVLEDGSVITRGDANSADDAPIAADQIRGKVIWHAPYLGILLARFTKGLILIVVCWLLVLNLSCIAVNEALIRGEKEEKARRQTA